MKALVIRLLSLLAVPQIAPVPQIVAITEESHHKLLLENSYVRIFHAIVPILEATLLHRHELPYVTVSLGSNDFMNAVVGKPETEVVQKDRQIGYSEGGFAHAIRPESGSAFNNITVELLRPQGTPKNDCEQIVHGPLSDCKSGPDSPLKALLKLFNSKSAFTTDDIIVGTISLAKRRQLFGNRGACSAAAHPVRSLRVQNRYAWPVARCTSRRADFMGTQRRHRKAHKYGCAGYRSGCDHYL